MLMRRRLGVLSVVSSLLAGCGGSDEEVRPAAEDEGAADDVDAPPAADGDWVRLEPGVTWQWQLTGTLDTSYDVDIYDIDLFDNEASTIAELKAAGRIVFCYFSAGSSENWRSDFERFAEADMGSALDGWEGERWLDITSSNVSAIMLDRLDLAVAKGCDGVEPDNVDGFTNATGIALTAEHQLGYNRWLANEAHQRNLAVLLKNDGDQATDLVEYFDGSLNEECHAYDECGQLAPFRSANKPILNVEYADTEADGAALLDEVCGAAADNGTQTLVMPWDLDDSFRFSCA